MGASSAGSKGEEGSTIAGSTAAAVADGGVKTGAAVPSASIPDGTVAAIFSPVGISCIYCGVDRRARRTSDSGPVGGASAVAAAHVVVCGSSSHLFWLYLFAPVLRRPFAVDASTVTPRLWPGARRCWRLGDR